MTQVASQLVSTRNVGPSGMSPSRIADAVVIELPLTHLGKRGAQGWGKFATFVVTSAVVWVATHGFF